MELHDAKDLRIPRPQRWTTRSNFLAGSSGLAKVLAGGTDLLVQLRCRPQLKPELIVDIKNTSPA